MNLWNQFRLNICPEQSRGFSLHFEAGIVPDLKTEYLRLARFLRGHYCFPVHLHIYLRNTETIQLKSGKTAYGNFRWFPKRSPFITIPSKVDERLLAEYTREEIYEQILSSLIHELTHYYQWIRKLEQSNASSEWQANYYRYRILDEAKGC